jgi:hypothetical protein
MGIDEQGEVPEERIILTAIVGNTPGPAFVVIIQDALQPAVTDGVKSIVSQIEVPRREPRPPDEPAWLRQSPG